MASPQCSALQQTYPPAVSGEIQGECAFFCCRPRKHKRALIHLWVSLLTLYVQNSKPFNTNATPERLQKSDLSDVRAQVSLGYWAVLDFTRLCRSDDPSKRMTLMFTFVYERNDLYGTCFTVLWKQSPSLSSAEIQGLQHVRTNTFKTNGRFFYIFPTQLDPLVRRPRQEQFASDLVHEPVMSNQGPKP